MSSDTPDTVITDDEAGHISATWQTAHRRPDDIERADLVTIIASALGGGPTAMLHVAAAASVFGGGWARSGRTLNGLVGDLDVLEGIWLDHIFGREATRRSSDANEPRALARRLHSIASTARQSAIAGFAHVSASATKKRARVARHDLLNAIGAVRNGVLLLDDQTPDPKREQIRNIATRNTFTAETLVRLHLSDAAGLTAALGWEDVGNWACADVADAPSGQLRGSANTGALDAIVRSLRGADQREDPGASTCVTVAPSPRAADVGTLTLRAAAPADGVDDSHVLETVQRLADAVGLMLEDGSTPNQLRVAFPLSGRDQRHDLGGAGQGYDRNAVRL